MLGAKKKQRINRFYEACPIFFSLPCHNKGRRWYAKRSSTEIWKVLLQLPWSFSETRSFIRTSSPSTVQKVFSYSQIPEKNIRAIAHSIYLLDL